MPHAHDKTPTFWTADARLAAIGRAAGGRLVELDTRNPGRVRFGYDLPADFDVRVINRDIVVNGADVLTAFESINGLLADLRRGR
jgi:hypothetical protein